MTIHLSVEVRNARLDQIKSTIGQSGYLRIRSGTPPAATIDADVGDILAAITLPSGWLMPATGGYVAMSGTWADSSADNTGTATHFRVYRPDGVTCDLQGTVGTTTEDMVVLTTAFVATQPFTITSFTLYDGNA